MGLSVIIPCLNDNKHIDATIESIRDTSEGMSVDIIVVDDCSDVPVVLKDKRARLIRTDKRVGGGMARHLGTFYSRHDHLLFTDSHMRFRQGWLSTALDRIKGRPNVVHVGKCLGLAEDRMELEKAQGAYYGARINYIGKDPNKPKSPSILEGVWDGPKKDDAEVECLMGACYFWPRRLFLELGGKMLLRDWGGEEVFTSLKLWLTGRGIRMMTGVEIGHMFRAKNGYPAPFESIVYNKLLIAAVCMPPDAARAIEDALRTCYGGDGRFVDIAKRWLEQDFRMVQVERHRLKAAQRLPFETVLARFRHPRFW